METEQVLDQMNVENPAQTAQEAVDKETAERAIVLYTQANTIREITGVDVLRIYHENDEIRDRVLRGELDFVGIYREATMGSGHRMPMVIRGANSNNIATTLNVRNMNTDQFRKLDAMLANGHEVSL